MKRILIIITMLSSVIVAYGQGSAQDAAIIKAVQFPNLVPPSPNVAAIERFGNIPVDYSTGVPDISIPVYTINSGSLQWSLGLSYHAGGIQVDQSASNVGLGWSLTGQGSISVTVMGRVGNPNLSTPDPNNVVPSSDYNFLYEAGDGNYDSEPDIYNYNFAGRSGRFIFKRDGSIFAVPYTTLKISAISGGFKIVDENGIAYHFTKTETTTMDNSSLQNMVYTSNYYLTKVLSASLTDSIVFTYGPLVGGRQLINNFYNYTHTLGSTIDGNSANCSDPLLEINKPSYSISQTYGTYFQLDRIDFKGGYVDFTHGFDRSDFSGKGLTEIKVYDNSVSPNILIKKFGLGLSNFYYNPLNTSTTDAHLYRLRLDDFKEYSVLDNTAKVYAFSYNSTPIVPVTNYGQDYWGYNNGNYNNTTLLETQLVTFNTGFGSSYNIGNANRSFSATNAQGWMLQRITWPTGGKTSFVYEPHQFYNSGIETGGGLRIKEVINLDHQDAVVTKEEYKYGLTENGVGVLVTPLWAYRQRYREVTFSVGKSSCSGQPAGCRILPSPNISRIYCQNAIYPVSRVLGSTVLYEKVTKYIVDVDNPAASLMSTYEYDVVPDETFSQWTVNNIGVQILSNFWKNGHIKREAVFRNTSVGRELVSEKNYNYQEQRTGTYNVLKVTNLLAHSGCQDRNLNGLYTYCSWYAYPVKTGIRKLVQITQKQYGFNQAPITTVTDLEYSSTAHDFQTKSTTIDSRGLSRARLYKYANDFVAAGNVYEAMALRNIIKPVIEEKYQINNIDQYLTKTNYSFNWFVDKHLIAVDNVQTQKTGFSLESRLRYYKYDDAGNPLEFAKENDIKQAIIWNYQNRFPVAQITNSDYSSSAYTSFESDNKGNWAYSTVPTYNPDAPTGNMTYQFGGSIIKTGLSTASSYIVSYWKKAGTVTVNGSYGSDMRIFNGWVYTEHVITNPPSGQVTVSGSAGTLIDELRLYPSSAQMTTRSYNPLVGVIDETDVSSKTTFYVYDPFQRLGQIKDFNKNIIKSFCYNYSGQAENCSVAIPNINITLRNEFFGSPFPPGITVEFMQSGVTIYSNTFPVTSSGSKIISVQPGVYQLRFTMPSGFSSYGIGYGMPSDIPENFWESTSGLVLTTGNVNLSASATIIASNGL